MKINNILFAVLIAITFNCTPANAEVLSGKQKTEFEDSIKKSLVYLNVTANGYENFQPWKRSQVIDRTGYGCAVSPYQIITTAWNIRNSTFIKARLYGQNEFVTATVKVIDYESNLCLLTLDAEAMDHPLTPIKFSEDYEENAEVVSYWLIGGSTLKTGRGVIDRAEVNISTISFAHFLDYVIANAPSSTGKGSLYCNEKKAIGITNWANIGIKETGLIPAVVINQFLASAADNNYKGFATVGFSAKKLIDPATRQFLKMPEGMKHGIYVSKVYKLGTGSKELKDGDVVLAIDGNKLNAYGRYDHPVYEKILYHHLISSYADGEEMKFVIWRDGQEKEITVKASNIKVEDMLVDYYEYDKQPEYIVTGGYVIQKLTRPYLRIWGEKWQGNAPPHLYHYYRDMAFNPTEDRKDIVVLSMVIPADINLGYHSMGRQIISKFNGMEITCIEDILQAQKLNAPARYDVVEFEHDYPTLVIDRSKLPEADMFIAKTYGIQNLVNINQ